MKNLFIKFAAVSICMVLVLSSCVSKKKYLEAQSMLQQLRNDSLRLAQEVAANQAKIKATEESLTDIQNRNAKLRQQMDSASRSAAGELAQQRRRLENLQALIDQQRKTTTELRQKMTEALKGFNSKELSVSIKNGKVYVSLQENLLFPSGSAVVNPKGKQALGKLAGVLSINPDINVNIEGHTDSVPIRGRFEDNWALSVARATSIVRILTKDYGIDPIRIIASGHSQYDPVDSNISAEGRARNRRTEIILTPKLDELYRMIEEGQGTETGSGN